MRKSFITLGMSVAMAFFAAHGISAQNRKSWADVPAPVITGVTQTGPNELTVNFSAVTGNDGADSGNVLMKSDTGASGKVAFGRTRKAEKTAPFEMKKSGRYTFTVSMERKGEQAKTGEPFAFDYKLPLGTPVVSLLNVGNSTVRVSWDSVPEADGYVVSYSIGGKKTSLEKTEKTEADVRLSAGDVAHFTVAATRGSESSESKAQKKTVRADAERIWTFTEFGTSTKNTRNTMEMLDSDDLRFRLNSCIVGKDGSIVEKGGKFESFFDGLSFYYTEIDPFKENWELTATVTVDYQNPMPDGQEGFGLIAMDKLGTDGEPMVVAYTNSAGIISKKFTTHVNGAKKEIKNGLGARFVTGLTDEVIQLGDAGISKLGKSEQMAFSYDQASDAIKTGDVYRITLKKDNTGYHAIYKREIASEDTVEEYIMYDPDNSKLTQLDKEKVYVGFAVARGVNATFSDISFSVTDPKKDPPAVEEPPVLVPLKTLIDCPTAWYDANYPFVFNANAKGTITITTTKGAVLVKDAPVEAEKDYKTTLKLPSAKGINDLLVTFDPEDGWQPEPKHVIAQYNRELKIYEKDYKSVTYGHSIITNTFAGKTLFVSAEGSAFGDGSREKPLDIRSAINYCKPGQEIVLLGDRIFMSEPIQIDRGNDGTPSKRKVLRADDGKRTILDFQGAKMTVSAINLYGSWWDIKNIDITHTPDDVKGLQIAGHHNRILMVDAYENGDTGIQISGRSSEKFDKWPSYNLIYGCESFGNADPAQNNADGFAAKLTVGEGNVFRNCVSHHNVDDGWDLYAKVESGPIGATLLDNCITYANGTKLDGSGQGDGNGFKMGGDGINVPHVLRNSISWGNGVNGITCNSNPGLQLENVTSYGNGKYNIALYGKGKAQAYPRTFRTKGIISLDGGDSDDIAEVKEFNPEQISDSTYFNGTNASKSSITSAVFESVDVAKYKAGFNADKSFNRIPRSADGVFDLGSLFRKTASAPKDAGADYNSTKFSISSFKGVSGNAGASSAGLPAKPMILVALVMLVCVAAIAIANKCRRK